MTTLLLVPTKLERDKLLAIAPEFSQTPGWHIERCGFGIAASGVMARHWIAEHRPSRVILIGIAGSLSEGTKIGSAYAFDVVLCDGIGDGKPGMGYQPPIHLESPMIASEAAGRLVTVCAASDDAAQARRRTEMAMRLDRIGPIAEDMEGYAVALACQSVGVPLAIIRGISNLAGDRNHATWQIDAAVAAAALKISDLKSKSS